MKDISSYIDHTLLKSTASENDIINLCEEARAYFFAAACVPPYYVKPASSILEDSDVNVCTVVGFPLGYSLSQTKLEQARQAVSDGADELDMVINQCAVKDKNYDYVLKEIVAIKEACPDKLLKVIVETCNLDLEEKERIVKVVIDSGADFIKTSTGFGSTGADIDDVLLFKRLAGDKLKIKAAGGIRDFQTAKAFIEAGATRIGASSGIEIVKGSAA